MIKTAVITAKVDKKLKEDAQEVLHAMGLTLSSYITASRKKAVAERRVEVVASEKMTSKLERIIGQARKDFQNGENVSPQFSNAKDAIAYLRREVEKIRKHEARISSPIHKRTLKTVA